MLWSDSNFYSECFNIHLEVDISYGIMPYDSNWIHLKFDEDINEECLWQQDTFGERHSVFFPLVKRPYFLLVVFIFSMPCLIESLFGIDFGQWKGIRIGTFSLWFVICSVLLYVSISIVWFISYTIFKMLSTQQISFFSDILPFLCCLLWGLLCYLAYGARMSFEDERMWHLFLSFCVFIVGLIIQRFIIRAISNTFMSKSFKVKIYEANFKCYVIDALVSKCMANNAHPKEVLPASSSNSSYFSADTDETEELSSGFFSSLCSCKWFSCYERNTIQLESTENDLENGIMCSDYQRKVRFPFLSFKAFVANFRIKNLFSKVAKDVRCPKTLTQAKQLARQVFRFLSQTERNYVLQVDFNNVFGKNEFSTEAFGLFGIDGEQKITKLEFIATMVNILKTKHNLDRSIHLSFQALEALDRLLNVGIFILMLIICLSIFGLYPNSLVAFSVSSVVAVGWIFGGVAKDAFNCLLLLFVTHPYDIGDVILMGNKKWTVSEINIFTTIFSGWGGEELCCSNATLVKNDFLNLTRNNEQYEIFPLKFSPQTDQKIIQSFRIDVYDFLAQHSTEFYPSFELETEEINDLKEIAVSLRIRCKLTADFRRIIDRKFLLNNFISSRVKSIH